MLTLMRFIERPHSPDYIKAALRVLVDRQKIPTQDLERPGQCARAVSLPWPPGYAPDTEAARKPDGIVAVW
jgi:DNA helicase-2/ATP-dependent DNA helicase PcrA